MNLQIKTYLASGDQEKVKQCRRPMVVVVNYYGPAVNEFTDQSKHSAHARCFNYFEWLIAIKHHQILPPTDFFGMTFWLSATSADNRTIQKRL